MKVNKTELHKVCLVKLEEKVSELENELSELQNSSAADTKSSMGDKYETSREMINLEKGKVTEGLAEFSKLLTQMLAIDPNNKSSEIQSGSLVRTQKAYFYIAVAIGQVNISNQMVFVISPVAPLAQLLLGKQVNDSVVFANQEHTVLEIV